MAEAVSSILIVDDEPLIGMMLGQMLESSGHIICEIVTSEDEAVRAALIHRPTLIIIDAGLCPGSGTDAILRIAALIGSVPHVFISGNPELIHNKMPDATVLRKPFKIEQLEVAIRHTLRIDGALQPNILD